MFQSVVAKAGAVAVVLVCTYALIAGSWRERFAGFIYLTSYLIVLGFQVSSPLYMLTADALCIPAFFIANWKSRHPWPRWALAGQIFSVSFDIAALFVNQINRWTFSAVESAVGWGVLLAILIGTIAYRGERRTMKAERQAS
ncbi:hypothetical protein [Asticcacaulis solisilvae]|uniref:hypothetical protein n=1 Tax=Asticcacaulis solisilvae TaxID=1217274 RepID=UPI003FD79095